MTLERVQVLDEVLAIIEKHLEEVASRLGEVALEKLRTEIRDIREATINARMHGVLR